MVSVRQEGTAKGRVRQEAASRIVICPDPSRRVADFTTDCPEFTDGDGSRNARFLSVNSVKSVVKSLIYTDLVYIRCPVPVVLSCIFLLLESNWRKCLPINHLQPKSPIFQSSPIKPNQGKSCLIAPKRAIFAAASLSRSGRESSNPYCNDMDLKAETSKVFLQPPSRAISMAA